MEPVCADFDASELSTITFRLDALPCGLSGCGLIGRYFFSRQGVHLPLLHPLTIDQCRVSGPNGMRNGGVCRRFGGCKRVHAELLGLLRRERVRRLEHRGAELDVARWQGAQVLVWNESDLEKLTEEERDILSDNETELVGLAVEEETELE